MSEDSRNGGRRAGATWVAGVGAFLLVAAAAVFVAVRWPRLTVSSKLVLVGGVTAACLGGGRWLRRSLPATGDVLFHLGAFLLPVDLAAAGGRTGMGWPALVLAEGVLGVIVLGGLGLATRSVVLSWAGVAGMPVATAGVAALTPAPAPLLLAGVAVAAEVVNRRRRGRVGPSGKVSVAAGGSGATNGPVAWAALAGLAPLLGAASGVVGGALTGRLGSGTLADLGLTAPAQLVTAPLAGALAAAVLAGRARRQGDVRVAFMAMASVVVGVGTSLAEARPAPTTTTLSMAAVFAVSEIVALLLGTDPFWARPLSRLASLAEATLGVASVVAASGPLLDPADIDVLGGRHGVIGLALGAAALAWLAADLRRRMATIGEPRTRGGADGWWVPPVAAAACVVGGTAFATASGLAAAVAMVAVGFLALAGGRPGLVAIAGLGAPWALVAAAGHPFAGPAVGYAAAVVAAGAVAGNRADGHRGDGPLLLTLSAVVTAVLAGVVLAGVVVADLAVAVTALALWLMAWVLDGARLSLGDGARLSLGDGARLSLGDGARLSLGDCARLSLGDCARVAMLLPVVAALTLAPRQTLLGVSVVAGLYALDAARLDRPLVGCAAGLVVQGLLAQAALLTGLTAGDTGLALCVGAVGWGGLMAVVDLRWRPPFVAAAAGGLMAGLVLSAADPSTFGSALLVAGALVAVAGAVVGRPLVAHSGGVLLCLGLGVHTGVAGVRAPEPYLIPAAVQSVVLGWQARRSWPLSSWVAYGPAVVVAGGVALVARLHGGGGGHALVVGTVGVVAVAVGGWRRLLGPLLAGTALLVVLTVNESFSALAGVPTWAGMGAAGLVLLAVGVGMERADATPTEAGLRLVDVLAERYE